VTYRPDPVIVICVYIGNLHIQPWWSWIDRRPIMWIRTMKRWIIGRADTNTHWSQYSRLRKRCLLYFWADAAAVVTNAREIIIIVFITMVYFVLFTRYLTFIFHQSITIINQITYL